MVIAKGQQVLKCKPFAHVVGMQHKDSLCDFCMRDAGQKTLKKCSGCKVVYYCQVSCQKKAWMTYHRQECSYLSKVAPKIPTDTVRLMARIIFKLRQGGMRECAELPDGRQRYFEDLMTHQREIVRDTQRIEAFLSFHAVLQDCLGDALPPKNEVLEIYGRVLINSFNVMNDDYQPVGIGLYLAPSVLDHSCSPNATVLFDGSSLILKAIEDVPDFDKIFISYTNILAPTEERKRALKSQYYFDCQCEKCSNAEESDADKSVLLCSSCKGGVPLSSMTCCKCGGEADGARKASYLKLRSEFEDSVILNMGDHPEPEEQCESLFEEMQHIFHPHDKRYLDLLEILYEQRLGKQQYQAAADVAVLILEHYYRHYPSIDINIGLMELKAAKLWTYLDCFDKAEQHYYRAKQILQVTHGPYHPLVAISVKQIKQDIDMGRRETKELKSVTTLQQSG